MSQEVEISMVEGLALFGRLEQKPERKPRERTVLRSYQDGHRLFPRGGFCLP